MDIAEATTPDGSSAEDRASRCIGHVFWLRDDGQTVAASFQEIVGLIREMDGPRTVALIPSPPRDDPGAPFGKPGEVTSVESNHPT